MTKEIKPILGLLCFLALFCGVGYGLVTTVLGQVCFHDQATGSLVSENGQLVGSRLVGQSYAGDQYLHGRPSAVDYAMTDQPTDTPGQSGGSNLACSSPQLKADTQAALDAVLADNPGVTADQVPADLVTSSGSGLDPHISVAAAQLQVPRIARATGLSEADVRQLVDAHTQSSPLHLGPDVVNVLEVNLALQATAQGID